MTENKKINKTGLILGLIAVGIAFAVIFLGFASGIKLTYTTASETHTQTTPLWYMAFTAKIDGESQGIAGTQACFSLLFIGVAALFASVITKLLNKRITSGVLSISGASLVVVAAILAFCTLVLYKNSLTAEQWEIIKDNISLGAGSILVGVFGIIASGLGIASGALNLKK